MSFENITSYEEEELTQEDELRKAWENEYWHYTDEQIDIELRKYNTNVRFDEHSIKENLKIQHKRSRGLYRVFHFNDYMQTCNEILTTQKTIER